MKQKLKVGFFSVLLVFAMLFSVFALAACEPTDDSSGSGSNTRPPVTSDTGSSGSDSSGGDSSGEEDDSMREDLGADAVEYKFEAECCVISGTNTECTTGCEAQVPENLMPSGGLYVMKIDSDGSVDLTFEIWAETAGPAVLNLCMGRSDKDVPISNMFVIQINGAQQRSDVVYKTAEEVRYFEWQEQDICKFDLVQGKNTIVFSKMQQGSVGMNFDYMKIVTESKVEWNSEHEAGGHNYNWSITAPDTSTAGMATGYCEYCRDYQEVTLPSLSEENGYTRNAEGNDVTWTYTVAEIVTKDGPATFTFNTKLNSQDFRFECETMVLKNYADSIMPNDTVRYGTEGNNPSGGLVVMGMNNADGSITLTVNATADTTAAFILCIGRQSASYQFNATHTLTVNGEQATIADDVVIASANGNTWVDWAEYTIAEIELREGENVIELRNNSENPGAENSAPSGNMDYFTLRVYDDTTVLTQVGAITPEA